MLLWSLLSIVIIILDQVTKAWVVSSIGLTESIKIIPGILDFVYVKNTGAAFSILAQREYGIIILSAVSIIFCAAVIWYILKKKPTSKLLLLSLSLMVEGAAGNVLDRIARGFVVDFIEVQFINFPVFNVADIAITVGAVLIIIYEIFFDRTKKE